MSSLCDSAETSFYTANVLSGFDIVGLDNSENIVRDTTDSKSMASNNFNDLIDATTSFDFVDVKDEAEDMASLNWESTALTEDTDIELIENGEISVEVSEEEEIELEFFSDGANIIRNPNTEEDVVASDIITEGWNEDFSNNNDYEIF